MKIKEHFVQGMPSLPEVIPFQTMILRDAGRVSR